MEPEKMQVKSIDDLTIVTVFFDFGRENETQIVIVDEIENIEPALLKEMKKVAEKYFQMKESLTFYGNIHLKRKRFIYLYERILKRRWDF